MEETQAMATSQSDLPTPSKPITLSPTNDLILGSLLLSALLRVISTTPSKATPNTDLESAEGPTSPIMADHTALAQATSQLFTSLRGSSAYPQTAIESSHSTLQRGLLTGKEALWGIAALTECMVLLSSKSIKKLFEEINDIEVDGADGGSELAAEVERVSVEEMIVWLGKARVWLVEDASERGGTIRSRVEAVLVKGIPTEGPPETEGGKKGGDEAVSSHLLVQGNAQVEVRA
jgi:hypothetical protein